MSNALTVVDTDTRIGALRREAHWGLVVAATGGGLTFTMIGHLMTQSPVDAAVHAAAGLVGGYLVGSGVSRIATGMRVRPLKRHYELVTTPNRFLASGLRVGFGVLCFYLSFLWAVGLDLGALGALPLEMLLSFLPVLIWVFILLASMGHHVVRAMR